MLCYRCGSHVPDGSAKCATCGQTFAAGSRRGSGPPQPPRRNQAVDVPGAFEVGDRLGDRYEIRSVIGQGPVGVVYGALDREVEVEVAVKLVTPKLLQTDDERAAFRREGRVARGLSHPNIVRLYEEGLDGERPYLVMQHLEGLTLRKIIDLRTAKGQRFSLREVEPILSQLTAALEYAHGQTIEDVRGVAHGNLKPENVIVLPDLLKVTDFREACFVPRVPFVAAQKVRGGSERYLAPEVVAGQAITPAADLYSLGVLLGEMLSGEVYDPSRGLDLHVVATGLPRAVDSIFKRLTAPRPEDRYARAGQITDDIAAVLAGALPATAGRTAAPPPMPRTTPMQRTAPSLDDAEDVMLHTGEFELVDDEDGPAEAPARPAGRVSFGLDASPPPPSEERVVSRDLEVLDEEILDDALLDESALAEEIDYDDVPTQMGDALPPPPVGPGAPAQALDDDAPFEDGAEDAIALDDADVLEAEAEGDDEAYDDEATIAPRRLDAAAFEAALAAEPDVHVPDDGPTSIDGDRYDVGRMPGPGAGATAAAPENTATDTPMFTSLAARRSGPSWRPYALLVLAGLVGGALGLAFTSPGKALVARLTASKPGAAQAQAATGPSPTAVMDPHQAGGTPDQAATHTPSAAHTPPPTHPPKKVHPPKQVHAPDVAPPPPDEVTHLVESHPRPTHAKRTHAKKTHVAAADHHPPPHVDRPPPDHGDHGGGTGDHPGTEVASVTPTPATGGRCPKGMVYIPAGSFGIGSAINDPMRNFAEKTLHKVSTKAYCIDRYEYGGHGHRPLTSVSWYRANTLCERQGKHLCSEAQWEKACKGPRDDRFPYGNVFRPNACNTEDAQGNDRHVEPGGSFPKCRSGYGVLDMSGNVSEWTASKFQANLTDRTQKGGAANRPDWDTRCASRGNRSPNAKSPFLGFRCCAHPK